MKILIAPNAFKNAISAERAAEAIKIGLEQSRLKCDCVLFPIGDGGDGTGELIVRKLGGTTVHVNVQDPLGRKILSSFGVVEDGKTAVIEMANASGMKLISRDEANPLRTSSFGTGQLMKKALDAGVGKIMLAVGGSATVDGGCGALSALGFRFLDATGELLNVPEDLTQLSSIDETGVDIRVRQTQVVILCDVRNPLLGPFGAVPVFAPQKGGTPEMLEVLEQRLRSLTEVAMKQKNVDISFLSGGGAAGGTAAGLHAYLGAELVNGIDHYLSITNFEEALDGCSLIITGEGSMDEQTLEGKAPFGVAQAGRKNAIPVIALAGQIRSIEKLTSVFHSVIGINEKTADLQTAIASTYQNLIQASIKLGNELAQGLLLNK